jgi:DNA repair exonuclease SbcCD nuclease subunit
VDVRFLHLADVHLDSPLRGLAGVDRGVAERIRGAARVAFEQLVDRALAERVDFLVIAGDLYDGDWRDYHTGLFFAAQMGRLHEASIPVFLLHGNHDAESQITRRLTLPPNVSVFSSRAAETFKLDALGVALHGQSFRQREVRENLVPDYPDPLPGHFNIGVLHTGLGGMGGHEDYAPCALADLAAKGYDYWALGHVHGFAVLQDRPPIVFPGNLQGRHIRETGAKGAVRVSVENGEVTELARVYTDTVRWARVEVSVADAARYEDVLDRIRDALEQAVATEADGRLLACRVVVHGRSPLHERLLTDGDRLLAEARAAALGLGAEAAWVERVVVETRPVLDAEMLAARSDALGDLQRLLAEAGADAGLVAQIEEELGPLVRRLPHDLRRELEPGSLLQLAADGDVVALIAAVEPWLSARVVAQDD